MTHQTSSKPVSMPRATPRVTAGSINYELLELLEKWRLEDETDDPEEIRIAEKELAEFKRAMNENRIFSGEPLLFP